LQGLTTKDCRSLDFTIVNTGSFPVAHITPFRVRLIWAVDVNPAPLFYAKFHKKSKIDSGDNANLT